MSMPSLPESTPPSIKVNARSNVVRVPFQALELGALSGRQRRHGLSPALDALTAESK